MQACHISHYAAVNTTHLTTPSAVVIMINTISSGEKTTASSPLLLLP